ncbi:type II CAAX endopeptidase family protein [Curtobacterium sp. ISL-83]|uniref:type II CAAX endopeptidase family protein n=1 Tax=Curtobacterium sp. ISL-83 TaxID=2819145 RepID=UPI001BE6754D|nr:type II CAAX endopeptidase family protein [Curtobacterium sp. ISL-83]MBT2503743.1 CPBP family intramembrane metalloprotease [Curtobacterium sp. ISL-83]
MTTIIENRRETGARGVRERVADHPLLTFFVLACGLSWLAWLPYVLSQNGLGVWDFRFPTVLGTSQLSGVLPGALLGPLGSAFLVTALADGRPGLRRWVGRLLRWRVSWKWYALALVGVPALVVLSGLPFSGGVVHAPSTLALVSIVPGLVLQLLTTGLAEEPGWRDFALPRLQQRFTPLGAAAVLGPVWALWHMPLFLSDWGGWPNAHWTDVVWFAGFCITFNVVMAWVFNRTGESLPVAMLLHVGVNNTVSLLWTDIYPTIPANQLMFGLFAMAAVGATVIVIATRGRLGYPGPAQREHTTAPADDAAHSVDFGDGHR